MARVELAADRSPIPASAALERALAPSNIRYKVLSLTFLVAFIMYMDRVCMGTAAPAIMREFGLDKPSMGGRLAAFNGASAIFQVPAGWMAARFGPRVFLTVGPKRSAIQPAGTWNIAYAQLNAETLQPMLILSSPNSRIIAGAAVPMHPRSIYMTKATRKCSDSTL